jgi:hypothetical protein
MKMAKKKIAKIVIKKTETMEEFIARGGEVTVVPSEEVQEVNPVVRGSTGGLPVIMTLSDGAHFFGETRKKKKVPVTKEEFTDKVSNSALPEDIIASLKKSIGADSE